MSIADELNQSGLYRKGHEHVSPGKNFLNGCLLLFLFGNIVVRLSVLSQYPVVLQGVVFFVLLCSYFAFVSPRCLKIFFFIFACSLSLYGVHSYQIHNIVFELFVSALSVVCLIQNRKQGKTVTAENKLSILIICYILLACLSLMLLPLKSIGSTLCLWGWQDFFSSVLQAPPESTLYPISAVNRLLLFFVFIRQISRHKEHEQLYRLMFLGLVSGAVLAAFAGILNHYQLMPLGWFRETVIGGRRLQSVFGNPGWFAEFLSISIPFILIGFLNQKSHSMSKLLLFGVLIVCEVAILLTYSRTGWLIYPFVLVSCWLVFYLSKRIETGTLTWGAVGKIALKVVVSVPLTIIVSYFLVATIAQQKDSGTVKMLQQRVAKIGNPTARKKIWQESLAIGSESPVFGLGYESYKHQVVTLASIPNSLYSKKRQVESIDYDTPHNHYLQIFISNGVVGLFFWLVICSYAVLILFYDLKRKKKFFNIAVLLSIIAFHQYGLAQSMQYVGVIWFLIFLSFGYAMTLDEAVLPRAVRQTARFFVLFFLVLTVIGSFVYARNFESRLLAKRYGLQVYSADQSMDKYVGFYPKEDWGTKGIFRWTGRKAEIGLEKSGVVWIDFSSNAPHLNSQPLLLDVSLNGNSIDRITFFDNRIVSRKYFIPSGGQQPPDNQLEFNLSRTWNPRAEGVSADSRNLGVAVGEPKFLSPVLTSDLGVYGWQLVEETGHGEIRSRRYRWTHKEALLDLKKYGDTPVTLLMKSDQPYISEHPVVVDIFQQNNKVGSIRLVNHNWNRFPLMQQLKRELPLTIRVNRTYNSKLEGYSNDSRDLGVALAVDL